jgi:hypothetical protein
LGEDGAEEVGHSLTEDAAQVHATVAGLAKDYGLRVFKAERWTAEETGQLHKAAEELSSLMGGSARFRRKLRWVPIWRTQRRTRMAAMAAPLLGVVFFAGASWLDSLEFKWQTVHELAHVWDIFSFYRLSRGLKRATGSNYGRFRWQSPIPFEYEPGGQWLEGRRPPLNALEDWADSVATYVYPSHAESCRPAPRLISPARWDYVREQMRIQRPYPQEWIPHFYGPDGVAPAP